MSNARMLKPRHAAVAGLFVLAGLILALAARAYVAQSRVQIGPETVDPGDSATVVMEELEALFQGQTLDAQRFAVIAERNLFSPDHKT
jgi:hypothetical protein